MDVRSHSVISSRVWRRDSVSLPAYCRAASSRCCAIGRALIGNPRVLLLDEPSEGLAPLIVAEVARTLKQLKDGGQSIVLVEQNSGLALDVADQVVIFNTGRCVFTGPVDELRNNDDLIAQHLGVFHAH